MSYLEALYGSQFYEISQKGKNGAAGRLNGNLFLSAFVIICIFLVITVLFTISTEIKEDVTQLFNNLFGYSSGKTIGRLLALPLFGLIYLIVSKTSGSVDNYQKYTTSFMKYPDETKRKATVVVLAPFFIVLTSFFLLSMASLL